MVFETEGKERNCSMNLLHKIGQDEFSRDDPTRLLLREQFIEL